MIHIAFLFAGLGFVAELLLLLAWWLERPLRTERPDDDRSRGNRADWR